MVGGKEIIGEEMMMFREQGESKGLVKRDSRAPVEAGQCGCYDQPRLNRVR